MTIAEQMGVTLQSTAYSVNVKERLDFSCAVFAADGALVANAPHMPVHLGSMGQSVRTILELNRGADCARATSGRSTIPTMAAPICPTSRSSCRCSTAASSCSSPPPARTMPTSAASRRARCRRTAPHIDQEGVLFDNFQLVENGQLREAALLELLRSGPYPVRNETQNVADIQAAGRGLPARRQRAREDGGAVRPRHGPRLHGPRPGQCRGERAARARRAAGRRVHLRRTTTARWCKVRISIDRAARRAQVDFTGTSAQQPWNFNAPAAVTRAAVLYVFRTLVDDDIPMNEGCLKPIDIVLPEGSIVCLPLSRPRSAPAMSRPRSGSPTRSTARWACSPPPRAR